MNNPLRTGSTPRPFVTQRASIKKFLEAGYSLTALEALSLFGAYRLAAHIEVLRNRDGLPIVTTMNTDVTGRTYARYSLIPASTSGGRMIARKKEFAYHAH